MAPTDVGGYGLSETPLSHCDVVLDFIVLAFFDPVDFHNVLGRLKRSVFIAVINNRLRFCRTNPVQPVQFLSVRCIDIDRFSRRELAGRGTPSRWRQSGIVFIPGRLRFGGRSG